MGLAEIQDETCKCGSEPVAGWQVGEFWTIWAFLTQLGAFFLLRNVLSGSFGMNFIYWWRFCGIAYSVTATYGQKFERFLLLKIGHPDQW